MFLYEENGQRKMKMGWGGVVVVVMAAAALAGMAAALAPHHVEAMRVLQQQQQQQQPFGAARGAEAFPTQTRRARLNHFDANDARAFNQHYWVNSMYYRAPAAGKPSRAILY